ncbi:UNVERIFIED_CONTAM: hypothetical protein Sradi_7302900, partial [Sesamum radiatum]
MFQLVGYPCCHAIAAIDYHRLKMEDFTDECFKKEVYLNVYSHMIHPVLGMHDSEDSKTGRVEPPDVIIKMGRPKKCRRKDANDVPPVFSQLSQDSQPQVLVQSHVPLRPHVPTYDPLPQKTPRNPFKIPQQSSRTTPDEITTIGCSVHKPSHEQVVHSKQTTQQPVQQQHPQSSGVHQ